VLDHLAQPSLVQTADMRLKYDFRDSDSFYVEMKLRVVLLARRVVRVEGIVWSESPDERVQQLVLAHS
jgi:hypothetical protein